MQQNETGQDTVCIINGTEYPVENVEDNAGQVELAEANNNMQLESVTAPTSVTHEVTVSIDGSAIEVDEAFYDDNYHPIENQTVHLYGSEYGSRFRDATATERPRTVPSKDGTSIEISIRADTAERTDSTTSSAASLSSPAGTR